MDIFLKIIACIGSYLLGAINFALIFAKIKKIDIRNNGSGNPGTMNMLRTGGKFIGGLTFICDALKGIIPAAIGMWGFHSTLWALILGYIAIIGHIFPIYYKFKGGKGVATMLGVFITIRPIITAVVLVCLIIYLFVAKYGFIGSILASLTLTITLIIIYRNDVGEIVMSVLFFLTLLFTHRSNIRRLASGKENSLQLGKKKPKEDNPENIEIDSQDIEINQVNQEQTGQDSQDENIQQNNQE